jgi:hypothetical protein
MESTILYCSCFVKSPIAGGIHRFVEDMDAAVWSVPEYEAAFTAAGLTVDHDPAGLIGRGLFIGTKPQENSR